MGKNLLDHWKRSIQPLSALEPWRAFFSLAVLLLSAWPCYAEENVSLRLPGWVGGVAFSPGGNLLAAGCSDNAAHLLDARTGKPQAILRGHDDYVASVAFAHDGKMLATGSYDHTVRLWDLESKEVRVTLRGHRGVVMSVAFSPDARTLATGSIDRTVRLWDVRKGEPLKTREGHKSWVNAVAFHPDGQLLASGSSDGTILLWTAFDRNARHSVIQATKAEVRSIAFSADGKWLAAGVRYGEIKVWDARTWKEQWSEKAHEEDVWSVAFTPDGATLISGDGVWNKPGEVKCWEAASGKHLATVSQSGEVLSLAVSPNGQLIATGCRDKTVTIARMPAPK